MDFFHFALVSTMLLTAVYATPTGAPAECCVDMLPAHGVPPQTAAAPYGIRAARNSDDTFTVVIRDSTGVTPFKGFLLQARRQSTNEIVGTFIGKPDIVAQFLTCDTPNSAVTHTEPSLKTDLVFTWDPEGASIAGVTFVATFVKDTTTFWTFIRSVDISTLP